MADDIDIEEHDVLENPLIKRIFPDLTILKKEINDYNNYEDEESTQSSNEDELRLTTQAQPVTGVIKRKQNASSSELINKTFNNKIILGSKHSSSKHKKKNINVCIKKAKVCLPNITQNLSNNKNFCKVCSILFASQESLNRHTVLVHNNNQKICMLNKNIECNQLKRSHECQKCDISFASVGNLNRHNRNVHSHCKKNKNEADDINETEDNVNSTTSLAESYLKECFHCDMMFATQQLLIDHLYEVLNSKKTQIAPDQIDQIDQISPEDYQQIDNTDEQSKIVKKKNVEENKNIEVEHKSINNNSIKYINSDMIYVCRICSYCFNIWDFYEAHMKKKHNVHKVKRTSKVAYEPNCKFCDLHYSTFKSYNTHLHKRHKSKILQKVKIQSFNNVKKIISKENGKLMLQKKQKTLLGTNKIKLVNALKQQKNNKEQLNFIKNDVKVLALKTIIFKCTQCNIHFLTAESAKTHLKHNILENAKCINCQKYFKEKDMNLHLEQHKYSNYFSVINIYREENVITTKIERKGAVHKTLYKCPLCAVHFNKDHIFEHYAICETESSQSTYCKICDILIAENIKVSHGKEHDVNGLKPSDFKVVEFKKFRNKPLRIKQDTSLKLYEEMYLFNLSYCDVCKCNVARAHYKSTLHFQSRCSHFVKYVCKYCGLVFSNKSINTHRKLHQRFSNLSLKYFTFYDLKSGKKMLPPIPVFPKCNACEKHFITKIEVKRHVCYGNNHLSCPTCNMKLSYTAYKLHIPFHNLTLKDPYKETEKPPISEDVNLGINFGALSDELDSKGNILSVFTCKNCVVSFNSYDEAIDHCHVHKDLDTTNPDTVECAICKLTYDASCYEEHQRFHKDYPRGTFKHIQFDVFHFGSPNDKWLKHMFGSMSQDVVHGIVKNSIYKYETRVKMRVLQNESPDTTVYRCERCQCFIDHSAIYQHLKTCNESPKHVCNICHLPSNSLSNDEHEKCNSMSKSLRIIEFNGKQDVNANYKIANMRKCYILYECRLCHSLVDKNYENHICVVGTSKECYICGLLLNEFDYDSHISKHKRLTSFNENFIKVILLGSRPNVNNNIRSYSDVSKFSGIVCDYSFFKCLNCDVCVKDQRNTSQHYCLIDAAKSKCPKCDLIFDEGKLKGHLKLHDTDPDFVKETILVQTFGSDKLKKKIKPYENTDEKEDTVSCVSADTAFNVKDQSNLNSNSEKTVKIYKCVCGLHYLTEATIKVHSKKCNGYVKTKQSKQNCSKCDLTFLPDVLFKHLIEHHGNKDIIFQYEIINMN